MAVEDGGEWDPDVGVEGVLNNATDLTVRVSSLERGHRILHKLYKELRVDLDQNTKTTNLVKADTSVLVSFTDGLRGFAKFIRGIGAALKFTGIYIAPIALVVISIYALLKGLKI